MSNPSVLGTGPHHSTGGNIVITNLAVYNSLGFGQQVLFVANPTEARANVPVNVAGTLDKYVVGQDAVNQTVTYTVRKNTADTSVAVSVSSGSSGWFSDLTHSATYNQGDTLCEKASWASSPLSCVGATNLHCHTAQFTPTSGNSAQYIACTDFSNANGGGYTNFLGVSGMMATEAGANQELPIAVTYSSLYAYFDTNASGVTTTIKSRVAGVDGAMSLSITAASTGAFQDTTHSDVCSAQTLYNAQLSGTNGATNVWSLSVWTVSASDGQSFLGAGTYEPTGLTVGPSTTNYVAMTGAGRAQQAAAAAADSYMPNAGTISNFLIGVNSNSITATTTVKLFKNDAAGNQSVSVGSSATGFFQDVTHTDGTITGDTLCVQIVVGGSGTSISIQQYTAQQTAPLTQWITGARQAVNRASTY